jgi:hypothetical protein
MSLSWARETLEFVECAAESTHVLFVYSTIEIPRVITSISTRIKHISRELAERMEFIILFTKFKHAAIRRTNVHLRAYG